MRAIERVLDARNTVEGKIISILLSVLLVSSCFNVAIFTGVANAEEEEGIGSTDIENVVNDVPETETVVESTLAPEETAPVVEPTLSDPADNDKGDTNGNMGRAAVPPEDSTNDSESDEQTPADTEENNGVADNDGRWVYVYVQASADIAGALNLYSKNNDGWYTIGRVYVSGITPAPDYGAGKGGTAQQKQLVLNALSNATIQRHADNPYFDLSFTSETNWSLKTVERGASGYYEDVDLTTWHLDGEISLSSVGNRTKYKVEHYLPNDSDAYDELPNATEDRVANAGTTISAAEQETYIYPDYADLYELDKDKLTAITLKQLSESDQNVIKLYYTKKMVTLSYTVKHVVDGVEKREDTRTYTTDVWAKDVDQGIEVEKGSLAQNEYEGYEFIDVEPSSVKEGERVSDDTVITLKYEKRKDLGYTVNYIYGDAGSTQETNKGVFGSQIPYSTNSPSSYKGANYVFEKVEFVGDGKIGTDPEQNVVNVYYALDENNDGDPDKYQTDVVYKIENGTWNGTDAEDKTVTITLRKFVNGEWVELDRNDIDMKIPLGMIADKGYESGSWDKEPASAPLENGSFNPSEFVYSFSPKQDAAYTVRYLEKGTNKELAKSTTENGLEFGKSYDVSALPITGYTVDGEQQQSVVAGYAPEEGEEATNVVTFYYTANKDTAYKVEHYQQNLNDNEYTLVETEPKTGTTGESATAEPQVYDGFELNEAVPGTLKTGTIVGDGSLVLKLYYDRVSYKVTYSYENAPESAPKLPDTASYKYGTAVKVADVPVLEGYTFSGWTQGDKPVSEFQMPAEDVELVGKWTANSDTKYKVERYLQNVDGTYPEKATYTNAELKGTTGEKAEADTSISYDGFTFDEDYSGNVTEGTIAGDGSLVLKVYYARNAYEVTYSYENAPESAPKLPDTASYKYGEDVKVAEAPVFEGYTFLGWTENGKPVSEFQMPAEDVELVGKWVANKYAWRADRYFGDSDPISWIGGVREFGSEVVLSDFAEQVEGPGGKWYTLQSVENNPLTIGVDATEIKAVEHNVINFYYFLDDNKDGIADEFQVTIQYETSDIAKGEVTGVVEKTITLGDDVKPLQKGTIKPGVNYKETVLTAKPGWAFDGWDNDPEAEYAVTGGDVLTFKANWADDKIGTINPGEGDGVPDKYQATFVYRAAANGSVTGSVVRVVTLGDEKNPATTATVTPGTEGVVATPAAGYRFDSWTGEDHNGNVITAPSYSLEVVGNGVYTYTANFVANNYPYTINLIDQATGAVLGTATYSAAYGNNIVATAPTVAGYTLVSAASQSIVIGLDNNVINFYYAAIPAPTVPAGVTPVPPVVPGPGVPAAGPAPAVPAGEVIADDGVPMAQTPEGDEGAEGEEETIEDDATPMSAYDAQECWVHILMIIGIVLTAVYGLCVVLRRLGYRNQIEQIAKNATGSRRRNTSTAASGAHANLA